MKRYIVKEETRHGYKCFGAEYDYWNDGPYQHQISKTLLKKDQIVVSRSQIERLANAGKLDMFQIKWLCDELESINQETEK